MPVGGRFFSYSPDRPMKTQPLNIFWFRRDLRLEDNAGLYHALNEGLPVLPLFIFDRDIHDVLHDRSDRRVEFIHQTLSEMQQQLAARGRSLLVRHGRPLETFAKLADEFAIKQVYINGDYEPQAIARDQAVSQFLQLRGIALHCSKDQVVFEKREVQKIDGSPYTVFTPYKNKWLDQLTPERLSAWPSEKCLDRFFSFEAAPIPSLQDIGFSPGGRPFPSKTLDEKLIRNYHLQRDFPGVAGTTRLGLHLRFGTVSIRHLVHKALALNETWLSELVWREFFKSILYHFPHSATQPFKPAYGRIRWRENRENFDRWCEGNTGYPIVDAGMRELNETGFMHNRVRMVTASFLCKHLLLPWQWGERYFAGKLLDYDLSANAGNWQWAAGSGCDAAPYFRVFNPELQTKKFDPDQAYIKKWVPETGTASYPPPMIAHTAARIRALKVYSEGLKKK
jgi:deoxyribodipyrimidine photo-lyase